MMLLKPAIVSALLFLSPATHEQQPQLAIPEFVGGYLDRHGSLFVTIIPKCEKACEDDSRRIAYVVFYRTKEGRDGDLTSDWVGTGIFEMEPGPLGRLGKLLRFYWPDGKAWVRGGQEL